MASSGADQAVFLQLTEYDGPIVFLQGQNGISIKVKGVVSQSRQAGMSVDVEIIATFIDDLRRTELKMPCSSNPNPIPKYDANTGMYAYHFEAESLSKFDSAFSGNVELSADVTVDNRHIWQSKFLTSATVISNSDQDNNRARQVALNHCRYASDQGPGLYSGRAEDSSFYRDPIVPIPEMGDQGYGEYIGPGADADWQHRSPSPAGSYISTEANTEVSIEL